MRFFHGGVLGGLALCVASMVVPGAGYAAEQATLTVRAAATQKVEFDIFLPNENRAELEKVLEALQDPHSAQYHKWLKPAEFAKQFGPSPQRVSAIQSELTAAGLSVAAVSPRHLHVSGSAKSVEAVFSSQLKNGVFPTGKTTVAFAKPFLMPSSIRAANAVVTGLEGTIQMRTHSRRVPQAEVSPSPANRYSPTGGYWFTDLKQAYRWPSYQAYAGWGSVIGILMEGDYLPADMTKYFGHEKIAPPNILSVPIAGGLPFGPDSVETELDIQQSGGMAPKAQIVLFNVPDLSNANLLAGLDTAVESDAIDVLNMSYGAPELAYTAAYQGGQDYTGILLAFDDLFAQGNAQGMTFVASSGDLGARPLPAAACFEPGAKKGCGTMQLSVEFPASSPHVTAVGGTNLVTAVNASKPLDSGYVSENADDDPVQGDPEYGTPATGEVWGSGGGDSILFRQPAFQSRAGTGSSSRTVPDVSLHMGGCPAIAVQPCGPNRSYDIAAFDHQLIGLVGTSASSPDFAGLIALKIERDQSRQGNVNYELYLDSAQQKLGILQSVFRQNIPGYNGYYTSQPGYDRVTGLGTLRGLNLLQAPASVGPAGIPQTPTNP